MAVVLLAGSSSVRHTCIDRRYPGHWPRASWDGGMLELRCG